MKTNRSYNIIGDIHARTCWKNLVRDGNINIFVGDYFDPYGYVSPDEQLFNFQEILDFKRQHPETVLLYGNHDLHYMIASEHYSRYDACSANNYWRAFNKSRPLFNGIAYPIEDKALVSHAGVTKEWYQKYIGAYHSEPPVEVAQRINELWNTDIQAFTFDANATDLDDCCGTSPTQSPVWIRPWILKEHDLFAGTPFKQIFGHTQTEAGIVFDHNLICVDCLATKERTYVWEE